MACIWADLTIFCSAKSPLQRIACKENIAAWIRIWIQSDLLLFAGSGSVSISTKCKDKQKFFLKISINRQNIENYDTYDADEKD
jgi:hypothetical protein